MKKLPLKSFLLKNFIWKRKEETIVFKKKKKEKNRKEWKKEKKQEERKRKRRKKGKIEKQIETKNPSGKPANCQPAGLLRGETKVCSNLSFVRRIA